MGERKSVRHYAMDLLARREHSRAELARKLATKGYEVAEIDEALDGLTTEGLQSDARYAEHFVAARAGRGQGPMRIRADLAAAGVDGSLIDDAFANADIDWRARARAVALKKFGEAPAQDYEEKTRRMRFLNQRGFGMDEIRAAVDELDE